MDVLSSLLNTFKGLPGVGPKSAQRIVYYLLQHRKRGTQLACALDTAMNKIQHCESCNNYTTELLCHLCLNAKRDINTLCIVENPSDISAIELSQAYHGYYFVLMGRLSPLDGIGPQDIHMAQLEHRLKNNPIQEVILALSPTIEGQATMHFIQEHLINKLPTAIKVTQLARGVPFGGELEFLDANTIGSALTNRALLL
jgi:recombination protein RecR